jgi:hypothetical protein
MIARIVLFRAFMREFLVTCYSVAELFRNVIQIEPIERNSARCSGDLGQTTEYRCCRGGDDGVVLRMLQSSLGMVQTILYRECQEAPPPDIPANFPVAGLRLL